MGNVIIFVIFIIFSVIRSLGNQGRGPMARPLPPGMPRGTTSVRPRQQQAPKKKEATVPRYSEHELDAFNSSHCSMTEMPVKKERPPKRDKGTALPKVSKSAESEHTQAAIMHQNPLVTGIIYSEILGPPRAKKPWSPRH